MSADVKFSDWFCRNYPRFTIIGDPEKHAKRIYAAFVAFSGQDGDVYLRLTKDEQEQLKGLLKPQVDLIKGDKK